MNKQEEEDMQLALTLGFTTACFALFFWSFSRDRSRYRNCWLLFIALLSLGPMIILLPQPLMQQVGVAVAAVILAGILAVPFFLIVNGITMIRREGKHISHLLSLIMGIAVLIGEIATAANLISSSEDMDSPEVILHHPGLTKVESFISISVIYVSLAFLVFMIYTVFLQIIPRKNDFDYVIIHGAGLLDGERPTKLLQDRLDKAIEVYRRDPTPPKMIPSGGKGDDEKISEAEAMKRYLISQGIPEDDILIEDRSTTTYENLSFSKEIIDSQEGRKYTALVTSNYHVYRALRYCRKIGLECTGIGSHVAFYYWPSALIREFIAVHAEPKHLLIFAGGWLFMISVLFI